MVDGLLTVLLRMCFALLHSPLEEQAHFFQNVQQFSSEKSSLQATTEGERSAEQILSNNAVDL